MVTKEMIKNSIEAKWRKCLIAYFSGCFGLGVFIVLTVIFNDESFADMIGFLGFFVILLPLPCLYEMVRYFMLFFRHENYEIYEVLLDWPTTSLLYRGYVYFTVHIDTKSGMGGFRKTKPIWSDYRLSKFKAWEYINSKIHIAYDEDRDRIIILGTEGEYE